MDTSISCKIMKKHMFKHQTWWFHMLEGYLMIFNEVLEPFESRTLGHKNGLPLQDGPLRQPEISPCRWHLQCQWWWWWRWRKYHSASTVLQTPDDPHVQENLELTWVDSTLSPEPRLPPSIATYNAAAAAAAVGAWRSALQLLQGAAQRSLQQSPVTLGTALNARSLEKFMGHLVIYVYLCVYNDVLNHLKM